MTKLPHFSGTLAALLILAFFFLRLDAAVADNGSGFPWRFAERYTVAEVFGDPRRGEAFTREYLKWEGAFFALARHPKTGLTYDGLNLDPGTGKAEMPRLFSAPSKECLDLALCVKALTGNRRAALAVSPQDPSRAKTAAVEILEKKVASYERFLKENPGYAGFLPWFESKDTATPAPDWRNEFPGLDNGEWLWTMLTAEHVLRRQGLSALAKRYKDYNDGIKNKVAKIFYDPKTGKVRGDVRFAPSWERGLSYVSAPGKCAYLTGEHGVHEGMMMALYVSLFGKGLPANGSTRIWSGIRLKRVEHKYGSTWEGWYGSAHESWAYLILPLRDLPEYGLLFRIREIIRTRNARDRGYPGLAASCLINRNRYADRAGIEGIGKLPVTENHLFAVYGAFPLLLECSKGRGGNYGLAWLINMLKADRMQGPLGGGECGSNDGTSVADVKTIDGSFTNVLALCGGLEKETKDMLKAEGRYERFREILLHEYREAFGSAPLREPVGFALPGKAVPKGPLGAYSHKSASDTEARIEGLIRKMTLEEKLGQMTQFSYGESPISLEAMTMTEKAGVSTKAEAALELYKSLTREGRLGSVLNCFGAAKTNELQRIAVEESRLGIPLLFGYDVIHGYRTIFPIPLGQAATWNPALVEKGARAAAVEASSEGVNWNFSPMVDIARDPRWGRVAEGAGEDPYLGSAMGVAQVRGYQTEDLGAPGTVAACAKHYVAYGAAVAGRDYNTVDISERTLREVYLPPFEASVKGGVATLMSAFNDLNGIPASGNRHTITDILRSEWGFQGFVVSDWESIAQLVPHGFAADRDQAGREAVLAGVDMDMVDGIYMQSLPRLVKNGAVPMEVIDEAVRRILRIKLRKGLFERPYTDPHVAEKVILCCEHRKTALDLARESLVLLRNEKNLLPLGDDLRSIALIGPLADDRINILGSWTAQGRGEDTATVLEALKARVKPGCKVAYTRGCPIQGEAPEDEITKAVQVAQASDVIILVLGEAGDMCGEAASRTSIALPGDQEKLLRAVVATGKPVALVLLSGRPLTFPADLVPAVLEAWFPGTRGAQAVVEALFADINPGGKLPISFPRNVGQIPIFYNSKSTGRPAKETDKFTSKYLDAPNSPMYPFGHGLSYTTFAYSGLKLGAERIRAGSDMEVRVTVTNTGPRAGDEVVQLYIQDLVASATRPVLELKGFHRIRLTPGESHEVTFVLAADSMASYDRSMKKGIEPGKFRVQVGGSSADGLEALFEVE